MNNGDGHIVRQAVISIACGTSHTAGKQTRCSRQEHAPVKETPQKKQQFEFCHRNISNNRHLRHVHFFHGESARKYPRDVGEEKGHDSSPPRLVLALLCKPPQLLLRDPDGIVTLGAEDNDLS